MAIKAKISKGQIVWCYEYSTYRRLHRSRKDYKKTLSFPYLYYDSIHYTRRLYELHLGSMIIQLGRRYGEEESRCGMLWGWITAATEYLGPHYESHGIKKYSREELFKTVIYSDAKPMSLH